MDIYEYFDEMKPFIIRTDWDGLEREFDQKCRTLAGDEQTERITHLPLTDYQIALERDLARAVARAKANNARAIYFEYDLDNDWQSGFFICPSYRPEAAGDDDWACDFAEDFPGPEMQALSAIYCENHFDRTPIARGSTIYLVARTVAAFGRASSHYAASGLAVCIGFHDQSPVMRVYDVD